MRSMWNDVVDVVKPKLTLPEQHLTKAVTSSSVDSGLRSPACSIVTNREVGSAEGIPWFCSHMHCLTFHAQYNEFFLQYCHKKIFFSNKLIYNLNKHLDRLFTPLHIHPTLRCIQLKQFSFFTLGIRNSCAAV
jgi:hypothetical protein